MTKGSRMRTNTIFAMMLGISLLGCQREDPRLTAVLDKLDKIDKRLDNIERRGVGGPAQAANQPRRPDPSTIYNLPVGDADVQRGAKVAKVTVIEGFDFACPYCAQSRPMLEEAASKHKDVVKVVSKQFVVHPQVATLPALAVCAGQMQGKGVELENEIWARAWAAGEGGRPKFDATQLAQENLEKIAGSKGLNVEKLKTDMQSQDCKASLARQQRELATIGVNGTPAFYINGRPYTGPRTVEGFEAAIMEEAKKADEALKSGVKLEDYYATIMKSAQKSL
jgi:protein-disulfide isomerase